MTTVREVYEKAREAGSEDFELVFAEEDTFVYVSRVEIDTAKEEVQLS